MAISKKTKVWILVLLVIIAVIGGLFYSGKISLFQGFMKIDKTVNVKIDKISKGKASKQTLIVKTASIPTAQSIATGSTAVIAAFDFVVPSSVTSAEIKSIKITKGGLLSPDDVSGLKLIYGYGTANPQSYSPLIEDTEGTSFVFTHFDENPYLFAIPGGTTAKIAIEATIAPDAPTGTLYYFLEKADDVKANIKVGSTTFPVSGPTMAVVPIASLELQPSYTAVPKTVKPGSTPKIAGFKLINGSVKTAGILSITLRISSPSLIDFENITQYIKNLKLKLSNYNLTLAKVPSLTTCEKVGSDTCEISFGLINEESPLIVKGETSSFFVVEAEIDSNMPKGTKFTFVVSSSSDIETEAQITNSSQFPINISGGNITVD